MWWPKFSLFLLAVSLVAKQATSLTADEIFAPLAVTGGCTKNHILWMDHFVQDSLTLVTSFQNALKAARIGVATTATSATTTEEQDGYVARKLFTKYFGVQFQSDAQGGQIPKSPYRDHWKQIEVVITDVAALLQSKTLIGPGISSITSDSKPWLSCTGDSFQRLNWGDQVFQYDATQKKAVAVQIGSSKISISQVYPMVKDSEPYYMSEKTYYFTMDSSVPANLCSSLPNSITYGWSMSGRQKGSSTVSGQRIRHRRATPGVVMCPTNFDGSKHSNLALYEITWQDPATKPEVQLEGFVAQGSHTMFHEITHLTTFWSKAAYSIYSRDVSSVRDYAYSPLPCLQLAAGTYTNPKTKVTYTSYHSTFNADSYSFFAFSWWYYKNIRSYTDDKGVTTTKKPATFYDGYLVEWDEK